MPHDPATKLSRFLSISRAIAGQMDYELVLQKFADELEHLIPHDHLDIVLLADDGNQICYEVGLHTSWSSLLNPVRPTSTSPIRSLLWGEVQHILTDNALTDVRFHFDGADDEPIYTAELRSRVVVPLRVRGKITGSMAISRHVAGAYDEDNLEIAQNAADLLAPYLYAIARGEEARKAAVAESEARAREEMLRAGALQLTEGMERERHRLGMDIHDQTLADLARLSRRISRLARGGRISAEDLTGIEEDLGDYLDELRGIVEDMKPGVLQLFGFAEAVDAHLRRCVEGLRPPVDARVVDESDGRVDTLPETIRTSLYRIVQEATNNAVKHAQADSVLVKVCCDGPQLLISVEDDGIGIDDDEVMSASGISHMQTRAALISANLQIKRCRAPRGTHVMIEVRPDAYGAPDGVNDAPPGQASEAAE